MAFFGEWGQDVEVLLQQLDSVVRQLPGGFPRGKRTRNNMSNEKKAPGCLGYIGDYTTQFYRDYKEPL